jgi:hypothetical protein
LSLWQPFFIGVCFCGRAGVWAMSLISRIRCAVGLSAIIFFVLPSTALGMTKQKRITASIPHAYRMNTALQDIRPLRFKIDQLRKLETLSLTRDVDFLDFEIAIIFVGIHPAPSLKVKYNFFKHRPCGKTILLAKRISYFITTLNKKGLPLPTILLISPYSLLVALANLFL